MMFHIRKGFRIMMSTLIVLEYEYEYTQVRMEFRIKEISVTLVCFSHFSLRLFPKWCTCINCPAHA